jgi:hypothetical protein
MRESKMATVRLPISFTLSVCTGVALFGLLHALIAVDRDGGIIDVVSRRRVPPRRPDHLLSRTPVRTPAHQAVLGRPILAPGIPPIEIERSVDFLRYDAEPVRFDFDWLDTLGAMVS